MAEVKNVSRAWHVFAASLLAISLALPPRQVASATDQFGCYGGPNPAIVGACAARLTAANLRVHAAARRLGGSTHACLIETAFYLEEMSKKWLASNKFSILKIFPCGKLPAIGADDGLLATVCPTSSWTYQNRGHVHCEISDKRVAQLLAKGGRMEKNTDLWAEIDTESGVEHMIEGDYKKAISDFTQALAKNPKDADAYLNRGVAYYDQGQLDLAIADTTKALQIRPDDAKALYNRANAYLSENAIELALADSDAALTVDPKYAAAYAVRCNLLIQKNQYDSATTDCNQAIRLDPNNAVAFTGLGVIDAQNDDIDRAFVDFAQALQLNPNNSYTLVTRGKLHRLLRQHDAAIDDLSKALSLDPTYVGAYIERAIAYEDEQRYDEAIADANQTIRLQPNNYSSYVEREDIYEAMSRYDEALADANKMIELAPGSPEGYLDRADIYQDQKQTDRAIADVNRAIAIDPSLPRAYKALGYIYLTEAQYESASENFSRALGLDTTDPFTILPLHVAKARAGIDDAIEFKEHTSSLDQTRWPGPIVAFYSGTKTPDELLAAATDNGERCDAYFYFAEMQLARKVTADARKNFSKALEVCPGDYDARRVSQAELSRLTQKR